MEVISLNQLQKYDEILEKINSEFDKSKQLEKHVKEVDCEISALKLNHQKISHVNVKIFGDPMNIFNLYKCDLLSLSKYHGCNFFLVEIILSKLFIMDLNNWQLHVNVSAETFCTNSVQYFGNENTILRTIPVPSYVRECKIEVCLFRWAHDVWNVIDLQSVDVDISYYFSNSVKSSPDCNLLEQVTKLHNLETLNCKHSLLQLQNQMKCYFDKNTFASFFIKNCYHQLNLESIAEFVNGSKRLADLQFSIGDRKVTILHNRDTNVTKLKCDFREMQSLKKFFTKYFFDGSSTDGFHNNFKTLKKNQNALKQLDLNGLLLLYQEIRKLWF